MSIVADKIKEIIEAQGLVYVRSVDINDLNEQLGHIDIDSTLGLGVYANVPQVENLTFTQSPNILSNYTIEVWFLSLSLDNDDTGEDTDTILDALKPYADNFFDTLRNDPLISSSDPIEGYTLEATNMIRESKESVTGWRMEVTLPIYRKDLCPI